MELVRENERRTTKYLQALRDLWETIIGDANREADRIR
jgi:hypothetical protein